MRRWNGWGDTTFQYRLHDSAIRYLQEAIPPGDLTPDAIPPEVRIAVMTKFYEERYARFLDEEIPALGGMTPREASARPEARPMLIELMKEHIHGIDRMNREESTDISLNSLLEELGLDELIA